MGCSGSNQYGACQGFSSKKQGVEYKVSVRNAIWSFIAIETIVAPVLWATDFVYCPIKPVKKKAKTFEECVAEQMAKINKDMTLEDVRNLPNCKEFKK